MQTEREQALAPPPGFRKAIPVLVKLKVVLGQNAICPDCGQTLGPLEGVQFDHDPAIGLRGWDPEAEDTIPACNDLGHIIGRHKDGCHSVKTTGRKGESDKNRLHGDVAQIAKLRRLTRKEAEFRQRLLAKEAEEPATEEERPKPKSRWPKRSFDRRPKHGSSAARAVEGDEGSREGTRH